VSQGSVPVSAKATAARFAAVPGRLFASKQRAEGAGRQEHDLAVGEMRNPAAFAMFGLRGGGSRTQDELGAAHRL